MGNKIHTLKFEVEVSSYDKSGLPEDPKELEQTLIDAVANDESCANVTVMARFVETESAPATESAGQKRKK